MSSIGHRPRAARSGFTLVEMAIVLFIIGLLIAGLIGPVEVQLEARDRRRTMDLMHGIVDALHGYAVTYGRLPCPDSDGDGIAGDAATPFDEDDHDTAICADSGLVPWLDLGVEPVDAWGNRITYRVTSPAFTWRAQDVACNGSDLAQQEFDLCSRGDIEVRGRLGKDLVTPSAQGIDNVIAIIVSHGRNGHGATAADGSLRAAVPASNADEAENADDDNIFIDRGYSQHQNGCDDDDATAPLCEYDDIVMRISRTVLNSRMVAAGQLP